MKRSLASISIPEAVSRVLPSLLVVGALLLPGRVSGQEIVGEVLGQSGRTLEGASVALLDAGGAVVASGRSDESGWFRVSAREEGAFTLHVTRLGYRSVTGGPYTLEEGIALEVLVVLHPAPEALDPIEVEVGPGQSDRLAIRGFYDRRETGFGYFFDREDIESLSTRFFAEFLDRKVPRLDVDRRNRLLGPDVVRNPAIFVDQVGTSCTPALWVDGMLVRTGGVNAGSVRVDDWVGPNDVEGVEVYTGPSSAPMRFSSSAGCAVIVVWTRGGR